MKGLRAKKEQEDQIIMDVSKAAKEGSPAKSVTKKISNLNLGGQTDQQSPQYSDKAAYDDVNREQVAYDHMLAQQMHFSDKEDIEKGNGLIIKNASQYLAYKPIKREIPKDDLTQTTAWLDFYTWWQKS